MTEDRFMTGSTYGQSLRNSTGEPIPRSDLPPGVIGSTDGSIDGSAGGREYEFGVVMAQCKSHDVERTNPVFGRC